MCNCAGASFSNCVGKADCNCNKGEDFNNMVGLMSYKTSLATGSAVIEPLKGVSINTGINPNGQITVTGDVKPVPVETTKKPSVTEKLQGALQVGSSLLGLFGKKPATETAPIPLPEEEKKVPVAVFVVAGGLLLLVIAFVIVKARQK